MNEAKTTIGLACLGLACVPIYAINFRLTEILRQANPIFARIDLFTCYLFQILVLGILYLCAVRIVLRHGSAGMKKTAIFIILFFAALYRLLLVPTQPALSTDIYRYIWDGRVQAHGINPYVYAPADEALGNLRDETIWPHMNRHASPTIYPAGAQMIFRALNRLGIDTVTTFKAAVALFDMGSTAVLMMVLWSLGAAPGRALIYAWHPLVIYELAGSGHLEGFMLFFVLLCLLLMIRKRYFASIASLALAASVKLYPAILLPAVAQKKKFRVVLLFSAIFSLLYLPYIGAGRKVAGFLPEYFANPDESVNLGLKGYLLEFFPGADPMVFTWVFAVILLCVAGLSWIKSRDSASALRYSYYLASLQIVLTAASLYPWYVVWIIPFLALFVSPAWFYFSFAVCLSYLGYGWVRHVEYIPFFMLLSAELPIWGRQPPGLFPRGAGRKEPTSMPRELH